MRDRLLEKVVDNLAEAVSSNMMNGRGTTYTSAYLRSWIEQNCSMKQINELYQELEKHTDVIRNGA